MATVATTTTSTAHTLASRRHPSGGVALMLGALGVGVRRHRHIPALRSARVRPDPRARHRGVHDLRAGRDAAGAAPPFRHNKALHEQVVLLSIVTDDVPTVPRSRRAKVERLRENFFEVTAHYGFMQSPRVTDILRACSEAGLHTRPDDTTFFLGREKLVVTRNPGLAYWRKVLFAFLSRNARPATDFFRLPPDRVVEMGMQLEL